MHLVTKFAGWYRSKNGGESWESFNEGLKPYAGATIFYDLVSSFKDPDILMLATKYGILKSNNRGKTWEEVKLLTPPKAVIVYSLTANPSNPKEIYYGTTSILYKSIDGGRNWITKSLPTKRVATHLLVDPQNPNILYMGVRELKK